jgi:hypothetical protein
MKYSVCIHCCSAALFLSSLFVSLIEGQIITAVQSGAWNSHATWQDGRLPETNATMVIPKDIVVSLNDFTCLNVSLLSIQVHGHFRIGSLSVESFRSRFLVNLMIFSGAILEDLTVNHSWSLSANSIISIYPNATFRSKQSTRIFSLATSQSTLLRSSINGPFTLTIDLQGRIETYSGRLLLCRPTLDYVSMSIYNVIDI